MPDYTYLVQRIYEDSPVTVGPFTGYRFTGWHRVTRYDGTKPETFYLPPGPDLDGSATDGIGFEISQMRYGMLGSSGRAVSTETEAERISTGQVLYGKDIRMGIANIHRALRNAPLLEGPEGAGDRN